jgi:hypothetical protein
VSSIGLAWSASCRGSETRGPLWGALAVKEFAFLRARNPGTLGCMEPSQRDRPFFWMNGEELEIDTLALFQYVREVPEPVPDELVLWSSRTANLASSSSEWSAVLIEALLTLLGGLCEHHDLIIGHFTSSHSEEQAPRERGKELWTQVCCFKTRLDELWRIAEVAERGAVSVWATNREDLSSAIEMYAMCESPSFAPALELPHIKRTLDEASQKNGELRRQARRFAAAFHRFAKRVRRFYEAPPSSLTAGLFGTGDGR